MVQSIRTINSVTATQSSAPVPVHAVSSVSAKRTQTHDIRWLLVSAVVLGLTGTAAAAVWDGHQWMQDQKADGHRLPPSAGWHAQASMPSAVTLAAAGEINGVIYLAGGINSGGPTNSVQAYSLVTNTWASVAALPETLYEGNGAGTINGRLYVAGGWNGSLPVDALYVYDPNSNSWTAKASMSHLSACGVTGVINSQLYVTTPCNGYSGYAQYLDVYNPANNSWTSLANSIVPHSQPAGGVINGKLYVAGGLNDNGVIGVTEVYDPVTNVWTELATMPVPVTNPASVELDGKLWVFGGWNGSSVQSVVQAYDPVKNSWKKYTAQSLPIVTQQAAAAVVDGIALVEGGSNGSALLSSNEALFVLPTVP